jgi:hypothetical protein
MSYDPVTTFAIYIIALLLIFTLCAAVADLWTAKVERDARRQARAAARAKLREERESSRVEWL